MVRSGIDRAPAASRADTPAPVVSAPRAQRSLVHKLTLALVWIAVFAGAYVATEPAPVDVLTIGLIVLLPVVGLTAIGAPHIVYLGLWLTVMATSLVAAGFADDAARAITHVGVSTYLCLASFVFAAFVARRPHAHTRLILNAYAVSAIFASLMGVIGYLDLIPGVRDFFTVHQRATGGFKDPNVFAAFLVPPAIYLMDTALNARPLRAILSAAGAGIVGLALLLSFSRGAWVNFIVAAIVYGHLSFVMAATNRHRVKLILNGVVMLLGLVVLIAAATQFDAVSKLFDQRANLDQSYDEGPEGRFGGQIKAIRIILESPLGLGALHFGGNFHPEAPHNVYISMFLNGGWLGGALHIFLVVVTVGWGLRAVLRGRWPSGAMLVIYAAFVGMAVEGFVIDSDHWRHFYLVMGLLWGQMFLKPTEVVALVALPASAGRKRAQRMPSLALLPRNPRRKPRIVGLALPPPPTTAVAPFPRRRKKRQPKRAARILGPAALAISGRT